uniref:Uncharacterized protein n=1 Tax=Ditylenchus dipsaci TaxID=166011 RepID=A0A915DLG6_9BILA
MEREDEPEVEAAITPERLLLAFQESVTDMESSQLYLDGFFYKFVYDLKNNVQQENQVYRCRNSSVPYCRGRIYVISTWHIFNDDRRYKYGRVVTPHSCQPNFVLQPQRDARLSLKGLSQQRRPISTRDAVDFVRADMTMAAKVLGCSSSSMARSYQNYKHEVSYEEGDEGMDKDDGMEILIPDRLNDKLFIDTILTWYDSRKKQDVVGRIIGFASNLVCVCLTDIAVPALLNAYNTSEKAREDMKSLYALAFLPISLVYFGFCVLVEEADSDDEGWIGG